MQDVKYSIHYLAIRYYKIGYMRSKQKKLPLIIQKLHMDEFDLFYTSSGNHFVNDSMLLEIEPVDVKVQIYNMDGFP